MKRTFILLLLTATAFGSIKAQDGERAVNEGENSVNVYYGVSLIRGFYKNVADQAAINVKIVGFGPIGIVFEHMVTESIGIGGELGYGQTLVSWQEETFDFATGESTLHNYEMKFSQIRAQVRANFHFAKSENFDAYFLVSAGYRGINWSASSSDQSWNGASLTSPIMIGVKPGLGLRYFFTDNLGAHLELAAGTPVMCGGLSLRF